MRYPRLPRLVRRNLPFEQSRTTVQVEHNQGWKIYRLVRYDFFHFLLRRPTWQSIGFLLTVWTVFILLFGGLYYAVDRQNPNVSCGLGRAGDPISFNGAFAFSLETCTTVGYTLPDSNNFFATCPALQVTIYFQMVWSMMFNAFLFAFFFSRLARADLRAIQVVFSKQAIVSVDKVMQQVRFQVRVYDVDARHPVVEAHARLYVVRRLAPVPRLLRLLQPNDELRGTLFLSMPFVIHHHVDIHSLLHPPQQQSLATPASIHLTGLPLRQADSMTYNRKEWVCPVCSENFATPLALQRHVRYQQLVEKQGNVPMEGTHRLINADELTNGSKSTFDLEQLRAYFEAEIAEVICVVEGIDPLTSGSFQSLQSYQLEDIVWDAGAMFHPCLSVAHHAERGPFFEVDLDRFHQVDRKIETKPSLPESLSSSSQPTDLSLPKKQPTPKFASASVGSSTLLGYVSPSSSTTSTAASSRVRMRSYRVHDALFDELDRSRTRLPVGALLDELDLSRTRLENNLTAPAQEIIAEEDEDVDAVPTATSGARPHHTYEHRRSHSNPLPLAKFLKETIAEFNHEA